MSVSVSASFSKWDIGVEMSNLSKLEAELPPGFRFHPRDEELICDYLFKKVTCCDSSPLMIEVDLNKCEPWDIPACVGGKEWYFYSQKDRKYATGLRTNRATVSGYWKATGKDRAISRRGTLVGMRKTLVFYQGRAPKGRKTDWVMHEFRLEGPTYKSSNKEDWVLCRVFFKCRDQFAIKPPTESTKPSLGSCYEDDTGSSSHLPPLMDSYNTFDQTRPNNTNEHEQVPCFSIVSSNQTDPNSTQLTHMMEPYMPTTKNTPNLGDCLQNLSPCFDPLSRDRKVLKAVLDHLTQTESSPDYMNGSPSFGEGSSESYLSEVGFPIWNTY